MSKKIIFVLGAHRSGTSLITRAIQVLGADLGNNLMAAAPDNPTGFWEDMDAFKLNERILDSFDLTWDTPTALPLPTFDTRELRPFRGQAIELLARKTADTTTFALKDPRLCLLLPIWLEAAEKLRIQAQFLIVVRNPLDVAASLRRRDKFDLARGLVLWRNHNLLVLRTLLDRTEQPLIIDYTEFLAEPQGWMNRLGDFINGNKPIGELQIAITQFIEEFIDPALQHSASTHDELEQAAADKPEVVELYDRLRDFSASGWSRPKAKELIDGLDMVTIEADNYRRQRRYARETHQRAMEHHARILQQESQTVREHSLKELAETMSREMRQLAEQKDVQLEALRKHKDGELIALRDHKDRELGVLRSQIEDLAAKLLHQQEVTVQKEREINEYKNSNSWKVTAPIRWVSITLARAMDRMGLSGK